jgi:hypothetical protein
LNKLISTKNTNVLFLASILVVGIIGISSFTAYGESYQSANCDDTNININGINQEQIQRQNQNNNFDAAATEAQQLSPEEQTLKALTGNGESLLNVERNIVNICINDNDNSFDAELFGTQEQTQEQLPPEPQTCEECFRAFLSQDEIDAALPIFGGSSVENLCNLFMGGIVQEQTFRNILQQAGVSAEDVDSLIDCLERIGLIFE